MKINKNILKKYCPVIIMAFLGAIVGYLYYYFVGCVTGTCPISSNPIISTIYCSVIGTLIGAIFVPSKKGKKKNKSI